MIHDPNRKADPDQQSWRVRMRTQVSRWSHFVSDRVPVGLRAPLGLLLLVGGVFGFMPILGFWMIPLGIAVAMLDVRAFLAWWRANSGSK